jgi:hypothetical protein
MGLLGLGLSLAGPAAALADDDRAPCALRDPQRRAWFGDLHVHTRHSLDASTQGTRTSPRDAYRFARGEEIPLHPFAPDGRPLRRARLDRPLDFAAVTDHAELFGEVHLCNAPGSEAYASTMCRVYRGWPRLAFFLMNGRGSPRFGFCGEGGRECLEAGLGPWRDMQAAADEAYDRSSACRFTSFVGYEWTRSVETASNLHRNVIFRTALVPRLPASSIDFPTPSELWDALDQDCRAAKPGCDAVVIPHNSNLSGGRCWRSCSTRAPRSAGPTPAARTSSAPSSCCPTTASWAASCRSRAAGPAPRTSRARPSARDSPTPPGWEPIPSPSA